VIKLLVGILKGAVIGGGVGYGAYALAQSTGFGNPWLTYGVVGALVGLLVGRPIWALIRDQDQTSWIAVLKAAFGFGVGCGLYALLAKVWNPSGLVVAGEDLFTFPASVGAAIGALYGGFVELDDSVGDDRDAKAKKPAPKPATKPGAKA
jgi:hypothetical protein